MNRFSRFLSRDVQGARRCITAHARNSTSVRGSCARRLKSRKLTLFRGDAFRDDKAWQTNPETHQKRHRGNMAPAPPFALFKQVSSFKQQLVGTRRVANTSHNPTHGTLQSWRRRRCLCCIGLQNTCAMLCAITRAVPARQDLHPLSGVSSCVTRGRLDTHVSEGDLARYTCI